jgi:DNA modification methylase
VDPSTKDEYSVTPNVGSVTTSKRTPIYGLHTYDSKKPPDALKRYIEHFTKPGDLVLDPFVGSGMTAVAALSSGRKCIAIDASPLATHITATSCTPLDVQRLDEIAGSVLAKTRQAVGHVYETTCGQCKKPAQLYYSVYSQTYECRRCLSIITLFDAIKAAKGREEGDGGFKASCPVCEKRGHTEALSNRQPRKGYKPVLVEYVCSCEGDAHYFVRTHDDSSSTERKLFVETDLARLQVVNSTANPYWHPRDPMMMAANAEGSWGVLWRPYHGEIRRVDQFFTKRNLLVLSALLHNINEVSDRKYRQALRFLFSSFVNSQSLLQRYHPGSTFPNMIAPGLLYVAPMVKEYNALTWFEGKVKSALKGFAALRDVEAQDLIVSTQSATHLDGIPSESVDYVITDPPYSGKIQYGELNFIQESWLKFQHDWLEDEIIVSGVRKKDEEKWTEGMRAAFSEMFRVLKPGRWLSLCYHDSSEGTWTRIQDTLAEVGFIVESGKSAVYIDTEQKSLKQITSEKITKRDLVINFRKPRRGESRAEIVVTGQEDKATFAEKVRAMIADYLDRHPGSTKDRIYDEVVSRLVRAGQMEPHDFESLLQQVADATTENVKKNLFEDKDPDLFGTHEVVRWYLKSTQLDVVDAAESSKEDNAAGRLRDFVQKTLNASPWVDGVHYNDLFEHFIYAVQEKPRRPMGEWLLDYFFKTDSGTYRLPATDDEAKIKAEGRSKGTSRRIKRYLAFLEQGVAIPTGEQQNDSTLADWIRHAKLSGMYEAGKMLFERGGLSLERLSEEAAVNVEEDYQVCVRMLSRQEKG